MSENVTLKIDNREVSVPKGTTVLEAARGMGIDIPTLCYMNLEDLCIKNAPASCRLCVVEVKGRRNLAPACVTRCENGMEVRTNTIRVLNARRTVMELILSDHPSDCLVCAKSGNCDLQAAAVKLGIREIPYQGARSEYLVDLSPSIRRDMTKCIYCRRCETMCNEVQTVGALGAANRGFGAIVSPAFDLDLKDTECTFCGQCVAVCPVDCFRVGPNFLVIDPDECIDCAVCVPECPEEAIFHEDDVPAGQEEFIALNAELSKKWPSITRQRPRPADADKWHGVPNKRQYLKTE